MLGAIDLYNVLLYITSLLSLHVWPLDNCPGNGTWTVALEATPVPQLIGDDDITFGILALNGAFTITPAIGPGPSRKGRFTFSLECEYPGFIDAMRQSASAFARKNRGTLKRGGKVSQSFTVAFDSPRHNASYGDLFATLTFKLFVELREEFMRWQVEHRLTIAVQAADAKRGAAKLRLLRGRRR